MERRLLVLRHAKSSWDDPSLADHDRPLSARGERRATRAASRARVPRWRGDPGPVLLRRAGRATLDGVRDALPHDVEMVVDRGLYAAGTQELLARCRAIGDETGDVLLVGHNPEVEDLIALADRRRHPGGCRQLRTKVPTGALAQLTVPGPWSELRPGTCHLDVLLVPKALPDAATRWAEELAGWRVPTTSRP
jgi:phosphohistidine phosphatase